MDRNRDGVITRNEWTGSAQSFETHDWNGDGRLSGDEVRVGATPPARAGRWSDQFNDWTETRFRQLDTNRDGRLARAEWRFALEDFVRLDRNRDNFLSLNEFLVGDIDEDRGDRFDDLDANRDNRIERSEWHGSMDTFRWLDRNGDGVLSRMEVSGSDVPTRGTPDALPDRGGNARSMTVAVSSQLAWTDTGITVRAGDPILIRASGQIQFSGNSRDVAEPDGARGRAATPAAPLPHVDIGALIARIGNSAPFLVGSDSGDLRAPRDGRLYLGVNDDILRDNRGEFRVTIIR
jgi:Ca2+-binding EF-hand superfamily protein